MAADAGAPAPPPAAIKDYSAEGLRGLAAVAVFLNHFLFAFFPRAFDGLYPGIQKSDAAYGLAERVLGFPLLTVFWNGHFAVCVFFVLSGYVLTKPFFTGHDLEALRRRAVRRYLRLSLPIAASIFVALAVMSQHLLFNAPAAASSHSDWLRDFWRFDGAVVDALKDALYRTIFYGNSKYNPPLWTMRIEFIGSLLVLIFYLLLPRKTGWTALAYYLVFALVAGAFFKSDILYYAAFFLGSLIWRQPVTRNRFVLGAAFLAGLYLGAVQNAPLFALLPAPPWVDRNVFYEVLGGWLLLWTLYCGLFRSFFASAPMVFLGRISFSLYLIHFLVLGSFSCWLYLQLQGRLDRVPLAALNLLASTVVLLVCAAAFERLVDRTGIRISKRLF